MNKNILIVGIVAVVLLAIAGFFLFASSGGIIDDGWNDIDDDDDTDGNTASTYRTNLIIKYTDGSQETLTVANPFLTVSFNNNPIESVGIDIDVKLTGTGDATQGELEITSSLMGYQYVDDSGYVYPYDFDNDGDIDQDDADVIADHFYETGAPGWIIQDIDYSGEVDGTDVSHFIDHAGSTSSDTPLDSGFTSSSIYDTNPIYPADNAWHDLFYHEKSLSDLDSQPAGSYVVVMEVLATGGSTDSDEFRYRALDASGSAIGDWQTAAMPPPRAMEVYVSEDGTLSIAIRDSANTVSTPD